MISSRRLKNKNDMGEKELGIGIQQKIKSENHSRNLKPPIYSNIKTKPTMSTLQDRILEIIRNKIKGE